MRKTTGGDQTRAQQQKYLLTVDLRSLDCTKQSHADPTTINTGGTSQITADLTHNSDNQDTSSARTCTRWNTSTILRYI